MKFKYFNYSGSTCKNLDLNSQKSSTTSCLMYQFTEKNIFHIYLEKNMVLYLQKYIEGRYIL